MAVADCEKALAEEQPLSEEGLAQVSGGKGFCNDDAPDGHEKTCWLWWYEDYDRDVARFRQYAVRNS